MKGRIATWLIAGVLLSSAALAYYEDGYYVGSGGSFNYGGYRDYRGSYGGYSQGYYDSGYYRSGGYGGYSSYRGGYGGYGGGYGYGGSRYLIARGGMWPIGHLGLGFTSGGAFGYWYGPGRSPRMMGY